MKFEIFLIYIYFKFSIYLYKKLKYLNYLKKFKNKFFSTLQKELFSFKSTPFTSTLKYKSVQMMVLQNYSSKKGNT